MAIAFVQAIEIIATTATSANATFASNVTAGNFLVSGFMLGGNSGSYSVSDNLNGSWPTYDQTRNANAGRTQINSKMNSAGGSCTVTGTCGNAVSWNAIVWEFSGVATSSALESSSNDTNDPTTNQPGPLYCSNAGISVSAGSVVVACITNDRACTLTKPSGYDVLTNNSRTFGGLTYKIFSGSASAEKAQATFSVNMNHDETICSYIVAAGGGGGGTGFHGVPYYNMMRGFANGA